MWFKWSTLDSLHRPWVWSDFRKVLGMNTNEHISPHKSKLQFRPLPLRIKGLDGMEGDTTCLLLKRRHTQRQNYCAWLQFILMKSTQCEPDIRLGVWCTFNSSKSISLNLPLSRTQHLFSSFSSLCHRLLEENYLTDFFWNGQCCFNELLRLGNPPYNIMFLLTNVWFDFFLFLQPCKFRPSSLLLVGLLYFQNHHRVYRMRASAYLLYILIRSILLTLFLIFFIL